MSGRQCDNMIIFGNLNPRGIQAAFDSPLVVFDLQNYVSFPTHRASSSLDSVMTDFPSHEVRCSPLGPVGSSDHEAILTKIRFRRPREESMTRMPWQWESADWSGLQ